MHPFVRRFTDWRGYRTARDNVKALDDVLHQLHWGRDRTPEETHRAIEKGAIRVTVCDDTGGAYVSNGLFLTRNGYALSTLHGVNHEGTVFTLKGNQELPTRICTRNHELDIALLKIEMDGPPCAVPYRFHEPWTVNRFSPIRVFTHRTKELAECYGVLLADTAPEVHSREESKHRFSFSNDAIDGDSGATVTLPDGSILGIITHRTPNTILRTGTKIGACLHLVATYRAHLAKWYGI